MCPTKGWTLLMSLSDFNVDINVINTPNKNYCPAGLVQGNAEAFKSRLLIWYVKLIELDVEPCYIHMHLRLRANTGVAVEVNTPGNRWENHISYGCLSIKDQSCSWWGKFSPWSPFQTVVTLQIVGGVSGICASLEQISKSPYPGCWGHVQCAK